jgi:zinc protease
MMRADRTKLPAVGGDPAFSFPGIVRDRLANGLTLRTVEHRSMPVVTFVAQVRVGSGSDPRGQEGLAGLTADMLDEGTGTLSAIGVSDALARIGAEFDIDIGSDATTITLTTLARFAERGAALLADLVIRPSLLEEDFERLRQLRLDRLKQLRDAPGAVAERAFLKLLYNDHPYGHLAIGSDISLRALTLDGLRRFHARAYQPEQATLVVGGDARHDELRSLAEKAFGTWTMSGDEAPPTAAEIDPAAGAPVRLAIVPRERAAQSQLRIGHLAARRSTPDYPALLVMNSVLGGQFVSRVNLKLREEKGYTYGARTGFDWRRGLSPFSLDASVDTKATADAIADSLTELSAIRDDRPATDAEMFLAKATLTRGYPRNFETVQQVARSVAQLVLYDLPDTYFQEFVPKVNEVTTADVTRAARMYLDPSRMSTLIVGDHQAVGESLGQLNLGDPIVLSPEG